MKRYAALLAFAASFCASSCSSVKGYYRSARDTAAEYYEHYFGEDETQDEAKNEKEKKKIIFSAKADGAHGMAAETEYEEKRSSRMEIKEGLRDLTGDGRLEYIVFTCNKYCSRVQIYQRDALLFDSAAEETAEEKERGMEYSLDGTTLVRNMLGTPRRQMYVWDEKKREFGRE